MIPLTETVLFHQNLLDEYRQSQNTAELTGVRSIKDWVDEVASANRPDLPTLLSQRPRSQHSPRSLFGTTTSTHNNIVDEPGQSLCPRPSKRARISAPPYLGNVTVYIKLDPPPGAATNNVWQRVFIPTLAHLFSACEDPWGGFPDDILVETLQRIWDAIYEDSIPYHVVFADGPVYSISKQSLDDWRRGFAGAAVAVITRFFASNPVFEDPKKCASFAGTMLTKQRFLFSNNEGPDPKAWTGLWRSALVLYTFAHHFNFAQGHVGVSDLPFEHRGPRGALALASAAVARVLTLIKNNQFTFNNDAECMNVQHEFNEETCGITTRKYLVPIRRLTDEQFQMVIDAALPLVTCPESPYTTLDGSIIDDVY